MDEQELANQPIRFQTFYLVELMERGEYTAGHAQQVVEIAGSVKQQVFTAGKAPPVSREKTSPDRSARLQSRSLLPPPV